METTRASSARIRDFLAHPTMILCTCHRIPVRRIVKVLEEHPTKRVVDVMDSCGAGDSCRCCVDDIGGVIREVLQEEPDMRGT